MTKMTQPSPPFNVDMTKQVCVFTEIKGDVVTGVYGHQFLMFVNANRVVSSDETTSVTIEGRIDRVAQNPRRAQALARARQRVGNWMASEPSLSASGLATLRLRAGLSQAQLAQKMDSQQSYISRLENNPGDIGVSTIKRIASALGLEPVDVFAAIDSADGVVA